MCACCLSLRLSFLTLCLDPLYLTFSFLFILFRVRICFPYAFFTFAYVSYRVLLYYLNYSFHVNWESTRVTLSPIFKLSILHMNLAWVRPKWGHTKMNLLTTISLSLTTLDSKCVLSCLFSSLLFSSLLFSSLLFSSLLFSSLPFPFPLEVDPLHLQTHTRTPQHPYNIWLWHQVLEYCRCHCTSGDILNSNTTIHMGCPGLLHITSFQTL